MKQCLIIFTFIFRTLLSHAQEGFDVVVDRPQEFIETYSAPSLEFSKEKIFCVSSAAYRTYYGRSGFLDQFDNRGNLLSSKRFVDSINGLIPYDGIIKDQIAFISGVQFISIDTLYHAFIGKFDSNMDTIWTKTFRSKENRNFPAFTKLTLSKNGNIALVGVDNQNRQSGSTDPKRNNSIFMLLDSLGNVINYHCLPKTNQNDLEAYQSIVEDAAGNYYACGFILAWKDIPIIVKYDKIGNFLWRKEYKDPIYAEAIFDGKLLKNGNLMFVGGNYIDFFSTIYNQYILEIDTSGKVVRRNYLFKDRYDSYVDKCVQDDDGNFICSGQTRKDERTPSKAWLIKFTPQGDSLWERQFDSRRANLNSVFNNIVRSLDGGYIMTGTNWIPENNSSRAWIVKTDSNGCIVPGCTTDFITEKEPHKDLFLLSPNPTEDYVNVYINDAEFYDRKYDLYLYDQQGRIVQHHVVQGRVTQVDLNSLSAGMYYYRIVDERNKVRQSGKVVVNR
ncbi:MAG: T9SS type A sorting domain-containing protein [Saprospiraceae bacterium]|nr:T9SS type A sorting domain-containing protein [Saprospiraceae bacterium]